MFGHDETMRVAHQKYGNLFDPLIGFLLRISLCGITREVIFRVINCELAVVG